MNEQQWTTIIKPNAKLWQIDFKEIWRYRDLLTIYIKRNITTMYKQTILGPLWFLIQPCLTVLMYMVVFGGIAGISTDGLPQPLFYLAGIALWQYFETCLASTSTTFTANANIFGKVYFPRIIRPLSVVVSNLVKFGVQLLLFVGVYIFYICQGVGINVNLTLLLFPIYVVLLAMLGMGIGMVISSMTTKYRDLTVLFSFVTRLWMYATPVIYPLSTIHNAKLKLIMTLNPVTPIIEAFKYSALGSGSFSVGWLLYSCAFAIVVFMIGLMIFNKVQRSFMDTV